MSQGVVQATTVTSVIVNSLIMIIVLPIPCSTLLFLDRWRLACLWTRISETAVAFVEADLFVQTSYIDLKGEVLS